MNYPGFFSPGLYAPSNAPLVPVVPPKPVVPVTGGRGLLQAAVKICDSVTNGLKFQTQVQVQRYTGLSDDGLGTKTYSTSVPVRSILEKRQRHVRTANGGLAMSVATILFLDTAGLVKATPAVTLVNGNVHPEGLVDTEDFILLPDGSRQAILSVGGYIIPQTGIGVYTEVYLG